MMSAYLNAISYYLPEQTLTNEDLVNEYPDWSVSKISEKTGINIRHIAGKDECASDLAFKAALKLFESGACKASDIDFILLCTQSPDYFLPTTACLLQHRLGIPTSAGALDFNLGCSGYIYGLSMAKALIESSQASNILLLTSETYSKYIAPDDRSVRTIFGDGAAATLVSASKVGMCARIGESVFGTDGAGAGNLIVKNGCSRRPLMPAVDTESEHPRLEMHGSNIFTFTLKSVPKLVDQLLSKTKSNLEDIDQFVFHQANTYMLEALRKKIGIPEEKFLINMKDFGNTVSSSIPIALAESGAKAFGTCSMLVGFGVGYSWGGVILYKIQESVKE